MNKKRLTKPGQNKKAVIFDFDGTIADSFEVFLESLSAAVKIQQPLVAERVETLRKLSAKQIIKALGVKPWQLPGVIMRGRHEIDARMARVEIFDGMQDTIKELASQYTVYILSTNSARNINAFLVKYDLDTSIVGVYAGIGIFGKTKSLRKLCSRELLRASDCVYVGDETRDVEAARKAGMKSLAVAWGFSDPEALQTCSPDALAQAPKDLAKAIRQIFG